MHLDTVNEAISSDPVSSNLAEHIRHVVGERNPFTAPSRHRDVQAYLEQTLGALGTGALRRHPFTWEGVNGLNLVLEIPGEEPGPPALIGADNASGVAVMLEPPRRPVWLAAFDLEEWGMRGSRALAEKLRGEGAKPSWMASLEMVGYRRPESRSQRYPFPFQWFYPDRGDFILLLGNFRAHRLLRRVARALQQGGVKTERFTVPLNGWAIPASRLSDQAPFWDIGVPGVMLTDTAWLRNPNYHRPTDRADTLDLGFMALIAEALGALLREKG